MPGLIDDETLQMYIEESKEHLETIESDLLIIEQQGKEIDEDLVNKVFRAAHSIKGGGGFLGLDNIKELAHKIENILDMVRNYQVVPSPDVVSVVLEAFDYLGELLDNSEDSNDMDISEHVVALKGMAASNLGEDEKESINKEAEIPTDDVLTVFTLTEFDLNQARKGGKNIYILKYDLIHDVHNKGKTPLDIINIFEDTGLVLDLKIGLDSVGSLDSEAISPSIPMFVLFSSIIELDLLGSVLGLDQDKIQFVPKEEAETTDKAEEQTSKTSSTIESPGPEKEAPVKTTAEKKPEKVKEKKAVKEKMKKKPKPGKTKQTAGHSDSLRVSVSVLDQLMNRAGELVLARNQLLQAHSQWDQQSIKAAGQRIDMVTSELQEAIMLTRMQPIGNIFNKFPRVIRDMSKSLGKKMDLEIEGKDVDIDKTILEGLADPLTHLVRNSADHGIEMADVRESKGKRTTGRIVLRAFHESGQVIIEIEDDGKGLDPDMLAAKALSKGLINEQQVETMSEKEKVNLIMLPGFSTADQVTEVSGRGVGMDVVKTNLDKLGGQAEIISQIDKGTIIRIKLPLTLAIIPSLLVASCEERYALPQVNVVELQRIHAGEIREKIRKIGGADVLLLRGELIPLLQLGNVLEQQHFYYDPKKAEFRIDRRKGLVDQRLYPESDLEIDKSKQEQPEDAPERRSDRKSDVNIVVVQAGSFKYGIVVDQIHDTVEIVVKPLGRHLKNCNIYAGATIMGDGRVALILDVAGMGRNAELNALKETGKISGAEKTGQAENSDTIRQSLLLFRNGPEEHCAVPLSLVQRIEQIMASDIEISGGKKVIQYRGGVLPVYALEEVANVEMLEESKKLDVILFMVNGHEVGLLSVPPLDVLELDFTIDETTLRQQGISGSVIIDGRTTLLVDISEIVRSLNPEWFKEVQAGSGRESVNKIGAKGSRAILLVEDSQFFRSQVKSFIEDEGHAVIEAEDGLKAWECLNERRDEIGLVVTDIEMPNMDGFELAGKIKNDERFAGLAVIALTSLAGKDDMARGREAGIDEYQVKLDRDNLIRSIGNFFK